MADQSFIVADYGTNQQEAVGMGAVYDPRFEEAIITATTSVSDSGVGTDALAELRASLMVGDSGSGADAVDGPLSIYFYVDPSGELHPLGVIVLRDSRQDLLPGTRENTETIPGRHGEIDFGSEFEPRVLELHVASKAEFDPGQKAAIKRNLAKFLNPLVGPVNLVFWEDVDQTYWVKYAGKIDILNRANWLEFTIPFKASQPFIVRTFEKRHTGSGVLTNEGTMEAPLVIEITGPVTNPSVTVGSDTLTWTGTVGAGDTLVIDTEYMTVKFNGSNAIANYSGGFPKLQPGDTTVTAAAAGTTTWKWRDRWI
jgi:predicted phage tail component-like protein